MLEVDNVEIIYNDVILAVKGVSLRVSEGKIVTLLGANGAGKSTLIKILGGACQPERGEIFLDGQPRQMSSPSVAQAAGVSIIAPSLGNS